MGIPAYNNNIYLNFLRRDERRSLFSKKFYFTSRNKSLLYASCRIGADSNENAEPNSPAGVKNIDALKDTSKPYTYSSQTITT